MLESWTESDRYEAYIGRWSRAVAAGFLRWIEPAPGGAWIDVGCGTGALSHAVLSRAAPRMLIGLDRSSAFAATARARAGTGTGRFLVADAQALPLRASSADFSVSALVLNFVPEPSRMIHEMVRCTRTGGTVALYVWDYAGRMEYLRRFWDAAAELDPAAAALDEGRRFPLCSEAPLRRLLAESGLEDVSVRAIDVPTRFRSFDDFWSPFLGGQGPAPGYVATLDAARQAELSELLRSRAVRGADGEIALNARAWAVRGRKAAAS